MGSSVQFSICECLVLKDKRHRIRGALYLLLNELMDTAILRVARLGRVPVHQQLLALRICEQWQFRQRQVWVVHHAFEQGRQVSEQTGDGRCLEQIRRVLQLTMQPLFALCHKEGQVKLARGTLDLKWYDAHRSQSRNLSHTYFTRGILQNKHHLEQWATTQVTLRFKLLYQLLKGDVLIGIGSKTDLAYSVQHLYEAGIA